MNSHLAVFLCLCAATVLAVEDPCQDHRCPDGQICRLMQVNCFRAPCPPTATCISKRIQYTDVCRVNYPVLSSDNEQLFCGRGPRRVSCPDHTSCNIHPADRYAVCCYTGANVQIEG